MDRESNPPSSKNPQRPARIPHILQHAVLQASLSFHIIPRITFSLIWPAGPHSVMSLLPRKSSPRPPISWKSAQFPRHDSQSEYGTNHASHSRLLSIRHHASAWFVPAALLLLALLPWPYGYYTFLRLAVFSVSAWFAYEQWKLDGAVSKWVVALGVLALLYNPLLPIDLNREIWGVLNIASATILLGHFASLRNRIVPAQHCDQKELGLPTRSTTDTCQQTKSFTE